VDVDVIAWVGVGLGGTYGCRCGILYVPMLEVVVYAGLVSLTSSSYPSPCSPYLLYLYPSSGAQDCDNLPTSCAVVTKSGNLNFLEPSGPLRSVT